MIKGVFVTTNLLITPNQTQIVIISNLNDGVFITTNLLITPNQTQIVISNLNDGVFYHNQPSHYSKPNSDSNI